MKILLSAYACEPNKGSEPGVGWGWAIAWAKDNDVWVITRDNNEPTIKDYLEQHPEYENEKLHFIYVGLSKKLTFWKKGRHGIRLFYSLWQRKAARIAAEWHDRIHFDWVQHITFVSYTQPTYMYQLDIPMIWGPIAGGENIPDSIHIEMSMKEQLVERVRRISQSVALLMPSIRKTMQKSKLILVATEETKKRIPKKYLGKTQILPAIGIEKIPLSQRIDRKDEKVKIVMVGRMIYWKAFDIGLRAFLQIADDHPEAELYILGEGDKKGDLKKLAGRYLNKQVFFEEPVEHDKIYEFYSGYDIFLNTTLRDSGCMTMMEAMSVGLPCIGIATGGPKVLLKNFVECCIMPSTYEGTVKATEKVLRNALHNTSLSNEYGLKMRKYIENELLYRIKIMKLFN